MNKNEGNAAAGAGTGTDAAAGAGTGTDAAAGAGTGTDAAAGAGTGTGADAGTGSGTGTDAGTGAGAEANANAAGAAQAGADADTAPIRDWASVNLNLPGDMPVDGELLASFGRLAVAAGLSPRQARELAAWNIAEAGAARERMLARGKADLLKAWGDKAEANQRETLALVSRIDRLVGDDSFSRALGASGAACDSAIIRGLHQVARLLAEDAIGGNEGAAASDRQETALEGLKAALAEARGR